MLISEIINKINDFDINIEYIDFDKESSKTISPFTFVTVNREERGEYLKCEDKKKFISNTCYLLIMDNDACNFIDLLKKRDVSGTWAYTYKLIKPFTNKGVAVDVCCIIFMFLHEMGHYKEFLEHGKKVFDYSQLYLSSYKKYHDELNQISEKINFASRKADSSVVTKNDLKKMNNLQKFYRNIPKEKNADKYAIENMPQYLEKYLEND